MKLRHIDRDTLIATERGGVIVCITLRALSGPLEASLRSIIAYAPAAPIALIGDLGRPTIAEAVSAVEPPDDARHELYHVPPPHAGDPEERLRLSEPTDVVLLELGCVVPARWLERLRDAAYGDSRTATATALCDQQLGAVDLAEADAAVQRNSLRLRPPLPGPGRCVFVRRSALELTEASELALAFDERAKRAFSDRCVQAGLAHVLADDLLVRHQRICSASIRTTQSGPLRRSSSRARRAVGGMSVMIDARILEKPTSGVQLHVLEIIAALARTERVQVIALVPERLSEHAASSLRSLASVSLITHEEASRAGSVTADVVHRPFQLSDPGDIPYLASLGERLIVTHQDLIGFYNPSYFSSRESWDGYRQLTRVMLGTADQVVFLSRHARQQAFAEGLVEPSRATVVPNGVDHGVTARLHEPTRPERVSALPSEAEVILCLGNDYRHKNRLFALRLLERLHADRGWPGHLVFAGPTVDAGSSKPDEATWLAARPAIAPFVLDLGPVSEAEKEWLYRRARLVVYPTTYEGFGLVPFEAADHGVPCMWAAGTALSEVLPVAAASIVPWNAAQSAERAVELLRSDRERQGNVEAIRSAGSDLSWDAAATRLLEVYERACDAPPTLASELARARSVLSGTVSEDAMRLVGPGGALPSDLERPLLAIATHRAIRRPVFGALKLGYRLTYEARRWGARDGGSRANRSRQRRR